MLRSILRQLVALPWELTAGLLLVIVLLVAHGLRHCPHQIGSVGQAPVAIQQDVTPVRAVAAIYGRPQTSLPIRLGSSTRQSTLSPIPEPREPEPTTQEATSSNTPTPAVEPDYDGWLAKIPATHSPFGICLGTFPGAVALDVQLLAGQPLKPFSDVEGSIDAMANLQQVGLQGTLGSRWFVGLGGYRTFTDQVGWCASLGLRF